MSRVGLRYIDEIRLPAGAANDTPWTEYIDNRLSAASDSRLRGHAPKDFQGIIQYALGEDYSAVMRYGALTGQSVGNALP